MELVILVGNIGSGKSTLTKKYQEAGFVVVSRDSIRYAIGGGRYIFNPDYEPIVHQLSIVMLIQFIDLGVDIIIDETNVTSDLRNQYIILANESGYHIKCVVLPKLSKEESINRRLKNPHGDFDRNIWEQVWKRFNETYEEPDKSEGFDEVIYL